MVDYRTKRGRELKAMHLAQSALDQEQRRYDEWSDEENRRQNVRILLRDVLLRGRWQSLATDDERIEEFVRELAVRRYELKRMAQPL